MKKNKTVFAKKEKVERTWREVDATGKILGRMATEIATYLSGKNKVCYTPHVDCGDFVIVTNAAKVRLTGRKEEQKTYFSHSGYPGGQKIFNFSKMIEKDPVRVIRQAVAGMLPKSKLGRQMITKLKIYVGPRHPHQAQKAKKIGVE
ncbi:MAG: 50S ribosomal protein L13 [bacterium]|nr:50S ribosomal protein L13 [Candidatus Margulisiibacteriota bacterium]